MSMPLPRIACIFLMTAIKTIESTIPHSIYIDSQDLHALEVICKEGRIDALTTLLSKYYAHAATLVTLPVPSSKLNNSPLHIAVYHNNLPIVKQLIAYGAPLDAQNKVGKTPLHVALDLGHKQIITYLLLKKAATNIEDLNKKTAYDYAKTLQDQRIKTLLLESQKTTPTTLPFQETLATLTCLILLHLVTPTE